MKKLLIIISHYKKLANTIQEYFTKMLPLNHENLVVKSIGGINNGSELGTEPLELLNIINKYTDIKDIIIFSDLGSATLSAQSIVMMTENKNIHVSKGSLIENGFSAYVLANSGAPFADVINASEEKVIK
ncbi:PTS-dependent dihydroxyacetone kinase phosphotransferase subunit DhaM [Mycoplasma leonicaptivi]|uniref:PTS-dependent dihydroxyacetone kinase phosphotransferase subunit DhaM n=1 Tax=Mycoplasma leonicaptivi TaxID=36742 RepID=UPI000AC9E109|nr:dihydroxyacetone kinase [Mycoplasma leonicaptivi]